jgi:hypothetical protein
MKKKIKKSFAKGCVNKARLDDRDEYEMKSVSINYNKFSFTKKSFISYNLHSTKYS